MWFKRIVPSSIESLPSSLSHTHTNRTFYFHWEIHALVNFRCTFFRSFVFSALTFHWHRRVFPPCVCQCMSMDSQFIHILRMENTHVNRHFAIFFLSFFFNAVQIFESFKRNEERKKSDEMKLIHGIECQHTMNWNDGLWRWCEFCFRGWFLFGLGCLLVSKVQTNINNQS